MTAVYSLNYLVGSVGAKGGVMLNPNSPLADVLPDSTAGASLSDWQGLAQKIQNGDYKLVLVHNANPVYGLPASIKLREALGAGVKVVSFSNFLDETTAQADLILPSHATLEDWGLHIPDPGPGYPVVGPAAAGRRSVRRFPLVRRLDDRRGRDRGGQFAVAEQ